MKTCVFFLLCLLCPWSAWAEDYTLQACMAQAIASSPRMKAAQDEVLKAEADVGVARSGFLPRLSVFGTRRTIQSLSTKGISDSDYDNQTVTSQGIQLTQTLFAGLTILNSYQRALLVHEYAAATYEDTEARLALEVQSAFLDREKALEEASIYEAYLASLNTNLRALKAMYAQNLTTLSNVLDTETEIARAEQKLSETRNVVTQKTIELKGLMHLPFEIEIGFMSSDIQGNQPLDLDMPAIRGQAQARNPALRLARLALAVVRKDKNMALGALSPRLSASLAYQKQDVDYEERGRSMFGSYDRDYTKEYGTVLLSLEWDLFLGGRDYYQIRKAQHEVSRVTNHLAEQESKTYTEVEKACASYTEARSRFRQADAHVASARENLAMITARLQKNLGTLPELMQARSAAQTAESTRAKARSDAQMALANLYYITGTPSSQWCEKEQL